MINLLARAILPARLVPRLPAQVGGEASPRGVLLYILSRVVVPFVRLLEGGERNAHILREIYTPCTSDLDGGGFVQALS